MESLPPPITQGRSERARTLLSPRFKLRPRTRHPFWWFACLGLVLLALSLWSEMFSIPQVFAAAAPSSVQLKGAPTTPNRVSPTAGATSHTRLYHRGAPGTAPAGPPQIILHNMTMPMKAASVPLQAGQATHFVGSDGRLELQIPAGAITTQDLAAAGGALTLHVTQVAPASGAVAGGSGHISFGVYVLQVADAHGALFPQGLRLPIIALYHFHPNELSLGLDRAYVTLNGSLSAEAPALQGIVQPAVGQTLQKTLGAVEIIQSRLDMHARRWGSRRWPRRPAPPSVGTATPPSPTLANPIRSRPI